MNLLPHSRGPHDERKHKFTKIVNDFQWLCFLSQEASTQAIQQYRHDSILLFKLFMNFSCFLWVFPSCGQVGRENRIIYGLRYLQGQGSILLNTPAPNFIQVRFWWKHILITESTVLLGREIYFSHRKRTAPAWNYLRPSPLQCNIYCFWYIKKY